MNRQREKSQAICLFLLLLVLTSCMNEVKVSINKSKEISSATSTFNASISNVQIINNQIVVTGSNLENVQNFQVKDGASVVNLAIESQTANQIVANTISNVTFAAGKVLDFVLSNAEGASTFSVNFSLCDSTLGGRGFDCGVAPTTGQFLGFNGTKWVPRSINGLLSYKGSWNPTTGLPAVAGHASGDYYIASTDDGVYYTGDWIVFNSTTNSWDQISNSNTVVSFKGRNGPIVPAENDYVLDLLGDVEITGTPSNGQVLKYSAGKWVNGTISTVDPDVKAFAKVALPACTVNEVLSSDGTSVACVTDQSGAGSYTGGANFVVVTDGSGVLSDSAIPTSKLNYLSAVTSDIQAQLNGKAASSSIVDWTQPNAAQTIDPTRLNLGTASRAVVTTAGGQLAVSATTAAQIGYLSSVTSDVQTQINAKISSETDPNVSGFAKTTLPTCAAGTVLSSTNGTSFTCVTDNSGAGAFSGSNNVVVGTNGSGALTSTSITTTELGYVSGVTSSIQTQLGTKQATLTAASNVPGVSHRVYNSAGTFYTELTSLATANRTFILPDSNGSTGDILTRNASGGLSWTAPAAGGVTSVNTLTGAVVLTTDEIPDTSATNKYFTSARVRSTDLTGMVTSSSADVSATDTFLMAIGKLQAKAAAVMSTLIGTVSTSNTTISSGDTLIGALGKLQGQITATNSSVSSLSTSDSDKVSKSTASTLTGKITVSGTGDILVPDVPLTSDSVVNQDYVTSAINSATVFAASPGKVMATNASGILVATSVPSADLDYVTGVTSSIQTQLNGKQATLTAASNVLGLTHRVYNSAGTFYNELTSVATANRTFSLPDSAGSAGDVLTRSGTGATVWSAPAATGITNVNGQTSSTVTLTTSDIAEGSNKYYTDAKVIAAPVTGLSTASKADVAATDSVLVAIGKLQAKSADIMNFIIGTFSTATSSTIASTDKLIEALGKLQAQINTQTSVSNNKVSKNTNDSLTAVLAISGTGDITNAASVGSFTATSLVSRNYVDSAITTALTPIVSSQWTTSSSNIYFTNTATGNVGVGTSSPGSKLEVKNGSITTAMASITTRAIDFSTANMIVTTATGTGSLIFANMKDGTSYTLIVQNTGSFVLDGSAGTVGITTWRCAPSCASNTITNTSGHVLITILKAGATAYVSYIGDM